MDTVNKVSVDGVEYEIEDTVARQKAEEGGSGLPPGGAAGEFLVKQSDEDGDAVWDRLVGPPGSVDVFEHQVRKGFAQQMDFVGFDANVTLGRASIIQRGGGSGLLPFRGTFSGRSAHSILKGDQVVGIKAIVSAHEYSEKIPDGNYTPLPHNHVAGITFSPDNRLMLLAFDIPGSSSDTGFVQYQRDDLVFTQFPPSFSFHGVPNAHRVRYSPTGEFAAFGVYQGTPTAANRPFGVYDLRGALPVQLGAPNIPQPFGGGTNLYDVAWSPDEKYLAVAVGHTSRLVWFSWDNATATAVQLASPAINITGNGRGLDFSPDGRLLGVGHETTPFVSVYQVESNSTLTKLGNPASLPAGNARDAKFSKDGKFLAIAHATTPFLTIYDMESGFPIRVPAANINTIPTGEGRAVAFSPDSKYLAIAHATTPFVTIYRIQGDLFIKLPNPVELPTGTGRAVEFSTDGKILAVGHEQIPRLAFYHALDTENEVRASSFWQAANISKRHRIFGGFGFADADYYAGEQATMNILDFY